MTEGLLTRAWQEAEQILQEERARQTGLRLARAHGITSETVAKMLAAQDGCCYLCDEPVTGKPCVDHDHRCCPQGRSCVLCRRGIACDRCNRLIGHVGESPELLRLIADRLEEADEMLQARFLWGIDEWRRLGPWPYASVLNGQCTDTGPDWTTGEYDKIVRCPYPILVPGGSFCARHLVGVVKIQEEEAAARQAGQMTLF